MKKTILKHLSLIALGCVLFSSCKKDFNNPGNQTSLNESELSPSTARVSLNGNYSSIQYDASNGYLVFQNKAQFEGAIQSLTDEINNLQLDKGETNYLLQLMQNGTSPGQVKIN